MRLTKLELFNFGPYANKIEIDFEKTGKKNLWILWGKNGAGKTHIFKAIKWCLYGWDTNPFEKSRYGNEKDAWTLIHGTNKSDVVENGRMYVNLWFDEDSEDGVQHYLVKRWIVPLSAKPRNPSQIKVNFEVSINGRLSHSPKEAVEAILPVAANQFFMFHGEDLRKMSQRHLDHTQKAIELIIDADTFLQGERDMKKIGDEIESELDEERGKFGVVDEQLDAKKRIQTEISSYNIQIKEAREKLDELDQELRDVEEKLGHYTESEKLLVQLEEKKKQLNHLEEERRRLLERRSGLASELPLQLLLPELKSALAKKEERHKIIEEKKKGVTELRGRQAFIESLINDKTCVCDRSLDSKEHEILQAKLKSISKAVEERENKMEREDPTYYDLRETIAGIERSRVDIESLYGQMSKNVLEIDELKTAIEKLEKTLGEINKEEIRQLSNHRGELVRDIREKDREVAIWQGKLNEQLSYLERVTRNIQMAESKTGLVANLESQLTLARSCADAFGQILVQLVEMRRATIEKESTDMFRKLTNKPDEYKSVSIDEEYNISVMDYDGNEVQRETLSTGEREIVALSFVLGLMRASEKKAPLVLDTFFVHLDEAHYSNIVRALPSFAEQVLLILTDLEYKNLREKASVGFFDSVNQTWHVVRDSHKEESTLVSGEEAVIEQ